MDVTGRVVQQYQATYTKGYHEIKVRELEGKGMYYYQLKTSDSLLTKKMIVVE